MSPQLMNQPILQAKGFRSAGIHCGIKQSRPDLALITSETPATAAAVYTRNAFAAAPIHVTRQNLTNGTAQALIINSGNANACTGRQGLRDAIWMAEETGNALGIHAEDVLVASTGIIGEPIPRKPLESGIWKVVDGLSARGGGNAAKAILTTDSGIKTHHEELNGCNISAVAKGSGMVHPNMATMLGVIVTDAAVPAEMLQQDLRNAVDATFNQISIDGSESTNDMVSIMANGASGTYIHIGSPEHKNFRAALHKTCASLAKQIAADGEGATRLMEVHVTGAPNENTARSVARGIASDNLVKAALHGADPNWGRILAAAGAKWRAMEEHRIQLECKTQHGQAWLFKGGTALECPPALLESSEVTFKLDLGHGTAEATAWGSDLTPEYVQFNSEYTT